LPKPKKPKVPNPDPEPTLSRYELGRKTGINDATMIFESTYLEIQCEVGPEDEDEGDEELSPPSQSCPCFITSDSQKTAFYEFIVNYRIALQNKIDNGEDVEFNQGLLDGFNYRIIEIKINKCISNIPT